MSLGPSYPGIRSSIPGTTSDAVSPIAGSLNANCGAAPILPEPLNIKKRRLSKMKSHRQLPRSTSTPHFREKLNNIMSDSDADKKRNKLGYQRISIACAHCRRRKIRCLVSEGDPQSRCQNCIRLKKECVFYPVDQQSAMENKHDPSNKSGHPAGQSSMPSLSVDSGPNPNYEQSNLFVSAPTLQSHSPNTFEGLPIGQGSAVPVRGWPQGQLMNQRQAEHVPGTFAQPEYNYEAQQEGGDHWGPGAEYPGHLPNGPVESNASFFGRFNNHTMSGDYAPFPINDSPQHAQPQHYQQLNFNTPSQPMRSVTHGNMQTLPSINPHFPMQSHQHSHMRYAQPPPLNTHGPSIQPHEMAPQSAPVGYGQAHPYMAQQGHGSTGPTPMSSHPAYATNFFGAQPGLPIDEEQEYWRSQRPG